MNTCQDDCDDLDPVRFPGNTEEACDGIDSDCIEDPLETDADGDGWLECNGDCDDDDNAAMKLGKELEVTADVLDNILETQKAFGNQSIPGGLCCIVRFGTKNDRRGEGAKKQIKRAEKDGLDGS